MKSVGAMHCFEFRLYFGFVWLDVAFCGCISEYRASLGDVLRSVSSSCSDKDAPAGDNVRCLSHGDLPDAFQLPLSGASLTTLPRRNEYKNF
eukprot:2239175-Rhodomonas_salina.2